MRTAWILAAGLIAAGNLGAQEAAQAPETEKVTLVIGGV